MRHRNNTRGHDSPSIWRTEIWKFSKLEEIRRFSESPSLMFPKEQTAEDTSQSVLKAPDASSTTKSLPSYLKCFEKQRIEPSEPLARKTASSPDYPPAAQLQIPN